MKTIGIIGAMDSEIAYLKDKIDIVTVKSMLGLEFFIGHAFGKNIVLVRSGIGKVNAAICAQVLIDLYAVDYIINVGVAGGIYEKLQVTDVVISTDAMQHDIDASVLGDPVGTIPQMPESIFKADEELIKIAKEAGIEVLGEDKIFLGRILSGDQFISNHDVKVKLWNSFKGYCAEMEGGAIAHTCYLNKIPFVIIRAISDNADNDADMSYEKFVPIAVKNSGMIVSSILQKI